MKYNELNTPCFIVKTQELKENLSQFKEALNKYFEFNILSYSVKTNSLPYILGVVKSENCFAEVVSSDEYDLVRKVGFSGNRIIYNGPMKDKTTFIDALKNGAYVNIETNREVKWLDNIEYKEGMHLGIRLNIDLNKLLNEEEEDGTSRFGFSNENGEFMSILHQLYKNGFCKIGIHMHRTSKSKNLNVYSTICNYVFNIVDKESINLDYLDVGGGFYGQLINKPSYDDYMKCIFQAVNKNKIRNDLKIIVEPGNGIIASPIDYLFSILDKKKINDAIICVSDATRNDVDPLYHKTDYFKEIYHQNKNDTITKQVITGCTCLEFDNILTLNNETELDIGDKILFKNIGAYTQTLSPNFIRLIPNVYAEVDGKHFLVREKWLASEWMQKNKIEI
ncbi:MAG: diaminopimelate decarboxylase [Bacilli bacterium]